MLSTKMKIIIATSGAVVGLGAALATVLVIANSQGDSNSSIAGSSSQNSGRKGDIASKVKVGDYINYSAGEGNSYTVKQDVGGGFMDYTFTTTGSEKWRVLNINDDGTIEIVSDESIKADGERALIFNGAKGYLNGVDELNNLGANYAKGKGAISGRHFNLDDFFSIATPEKLAARFSDNLPSTTTKEEKMQALRQIIKKNSWSNHNSRLEDFDKEHTVDSDRTWAPDKNSETGYTKQSTLTVMSDFLGRITLGDAITNRSEMALLMGSTNDACTWIANSFSEYAPNSVMPTRIHAVYGLYYTMPNLSSLSYSKLDGAEIATSFSEETIQGNTTTGAYIRPVVKLDSGLSISGGSGSEYDPFTFN